MERVWILHGEKDRERMHTWKRNKEGNPRSWLKVMDHPWMPNYNLLKNWESRTWCLDIYNLMCLGKVCQAWVSNSFEMYKHKWYQKDTLRRGCIMRKYSLWHQELEESFHSGSFNDAKGRNLLDGCYICLLVQTIRGNVVIESSITFWDVFIEQNFSELTKAMYAMK